MSNARASSTRLEGPLPQHDATTDEHANPFLAALFQRPTDDAVAELIKSCEYHPPCEDGTPAELEEKDEEPPPAPADDPTVPRYNVVDWVAEEAELDAKIKAVAARKVELEAAEQQRRTQLERSQELLQQLQARREPTAATSPERPGRGDGYSRRDLVHWHIQRQAVHHRDQLLHEPTDEVLDSLIREGDAALTAAQGKAEDWQFNVSALEHDHIVLQTTWTDGEWQTRRLCAFT